MRVSIAVGGEPKDLDQLTAVYAGAHAFEVKDPDERNRAWGLLEARHPNLVDFQLPERTDAAMMSASCKFVTVLDYRKGLGHVDELSIDDGGRAQHDIRTEAMGFDNCQTRPDPAQSDVTLVGSRLGARPRSVRFLSVLDTSIVAAPTIRSGSGC